MKIAIVGADDVGRSLGAALKSKGHTIVYGIPEPERSDERNTKSVGAAVRSSEAVILATPWTLTEALVCEHATDLANKIVIDATNPLNPTMTGLALGFLTSGVRVATEPGASGEVLQNLQFGWHRRSRAAGLRGR